MDISLQQASYYKRFLRVLDHVDSNLAAPLSVLDLSQVARSSRFHFHRQFVGLFGVPVARYVHLRRLQTAVWQLAYRPESSVLDVAARAGYETPEAFARAFKRVLSVTPTEFRRAPAWDTWRAAYAPIRAIRKHLMNSNTSLTSVSIVQLPATRVAVLEHRGSHDLLHESIQKFITYRRRNHLSPQRSATFNLVYDNPHTTPPAAFRLDLCCAVTSSVEPNPEGLVEGIIPGGKCASLRCRGGDEALEACLQYLYATWLPGSGEEPRDVPLVLQRIAFFPDVPENDAVTDIFLPLA